MGYTHYWEFHQVPSAEKFAEFIEGVKHLTATAQEAGIAIGDEKYESNSLRFNGVGAESMKISLSHSLLGIKDTITDSAKQPVSLTTQP